MVLKYSFTVKLKSKNGNKYNLLNQLHNVTQTRDILWHDDFANLTM